MEQTLGEFIADEQETLKRFVAFWRENAARGQEGFPETMNSADWWEQLQFFAQIETKSNDTDSFDANRSPKKRAG